MNYDIFISDYANTKVLQFPTVPKELPSFANELKNEEFETYWDLPYNFIEKKGLLKGTLDDWLPRDASKYNFLKSKVNAKEIIDLVENAKNNTEPIKLVITTIDGFYVNDTFSIEKFECSITKNGDYKYSLEVKQWRNPNPIVTAATTSTQGWNQDSTGWWYVYDASGNYYMDSWQLIENEWYYFQSNGYAMQSTWFQDGNSWYYFSDSAKMYSSAWLTLDSGTYYLGSDGAMYADGTYNIDGEDYTFDSNGVLQ